MYPRPSPQNKCPAPSTQTKSSETKLHNAHTNDRLPTTKKNCTTYTHESTVCQQTTKQMCTTCTYQTTVCCMRYISANNCTSLGPFFSRTKHSPAGSRIESTALGTRRPESLPPTHLHAVRRSITAIEKGFHLKQAVVGAGIESHTLLTAHCASFDQGNGKKVSI